MIFLHFLGHFQSKTYVSKAFFDDNESKASIFRPFLIGKKLLFKRFST